MSKKYKVNMNIDLSKCTPNGGILKYPVDKAIDPSGLKDRSGAEAFAFLVGVAVNGANPRVGYGDLKNLRNLIKGMTAAIKTGEYIANKTDLDLIVKSIDMNKNWPNNDETFEVLESIVEAVNKAQPTE